MGAEMRLEELLHRHAEQPEVRAALNDLDQLIQRDSQSILVAEALAGIPHGVVPAINAAPDPALHPRGETLHSRVADLLRRSGSEDAEVLIRALEAERRQR
jgi:hypothetical protein